MFAVTSKPVIEELRTRGFASVPTDAANIAGGEWLSEAHELHPRAERIVKEKYELWTDGQEFRSPVSYGIAFDTECLRAVHASQPMLTLASELAGRAMEPTYSGYLYFEDGDFIGLHTDLPACELTFLAPVAADCPPLIVHPELVGQRPEELKELSEAVDGSPTGGTTVPVVPDFLAALFGGGLPHQTRRVTASDTSIMATLCYAAK